MILKELKYLSVLQLCTVPFWINYIVDELKYQLLEKIYVKKHLYSLSLCLKYLFNILYI